eukprot:Cvel_12530.t1-p1 / transcript=Cvel_12530.t1 / gene=Cvel_12530 / organism=Chromera_velia_CCMP2878 / gene_product=Tetratricopeptide repeat protein 21B, putative / transcript_product=Tetratricopeptide repeat protein 21B, putative / location=Cvel_scaffold822:61222-65513(+) / protein_length=190 / sequence_SO=supercontig / SO=protein_coding / is_pseudo=false
MMNQTEKAETLIFYYARERFFRKIQNICQEELSTKGDSVFSLWNAYGLFKEGAVSEALKETTGLMGRREVGLPATVACLHYHEKMPSVDQDAVRDLKQRVQSELQSASDHAVLTTAMLQMLFEDFTNARANARKVAEAVPSPLAFAIKGWVEHEAANAASIANQAKASADAIEKCSAAFEAAMRQRGGDQ